MHGLDQRGREAFIVHAVIARHKQPAARFRREPGDVALNLFRLQAFQGESVAPLRLINSVELFRFASIRSDDQGSVAAIP